MSLKAPGLLILNSEPGFGSSTQMLAKGMSPFVSGQLSPLFQIGGPRTLQFAPRLSFLQTSHSSHERHKLRSIDTRESAFLMAISVWLRPAGLYKGASEP